jgi:hypothetical protein
MHFATIKGLRKEKYTLQSQNWRESAKTNKTYDLLPPAATEGFILMRRLMTFVDLPGHVYQYRLNIGIR